MKSAPLEPDRLLNRQTLGNLLIRADELKTLGIAKNRPQLIRDWMIINTFLFTGLRRFEVCNLKCTDFKIYGGNSYLVVQSGKGGKKRHVHLPKEFKKNVSWYLRWKVERSELDGPDAYFLRTERSAKYSPSGIYKRWKKYCPDHRLHDARHTAASALLEATNSLKLVQSVLGHSSITSTQIYSHLTPEQSLAGMAAMEKLVRSTTKRPRSSIPSASSA